MMSEEFEQGVCFGTLGQLPDLRTIV
eukprot:COSAG02_NODE_60841_length_270_cov_0.602339_2_plen_25_part_01